MKLLFKQRLFSWFDSYDIYYEDGSVAFTVQGQLSWGHKLHILDPYGNHIGTVKEVVLSFLPRFELSIGGQFAGTLSKEFSFLRPKYSIDFNGWQVSGNFLAWDYEISDSFGRPIAAISKELFRFTDTYSIDVYNPQDALGALMVVLSIDAEKCE